MCVPLGIGSPLTDAVVICGSASLGGMTFNKDATNTFCKT